MTTQLAFFDDAIGKRAVEVAGHDVSPLPPTGSPAAPVRPAARTRRPKLTASEAADLYRQGKSACEIAAAHGITRQGAETRIRAGGLGGVQWCPIHRMHEELRMTGTEAVS